MAIKRRRDYKAEYARRIELALQRGYSRSVARGHARKKIGEISLSRARALDVPGGSRLVRGPKETRHGYRPTYTDIRRRLRTLNLRWSLEILKGKKGRIPQAWVGNGKDRYLESDETREEFIEAITGWGFSEREAYSLWFSP